MRQDYCRQRVRYNGGRLFPPLPQTPSAPTHAMIIRLYDESAEQGRLVHDRAGAVSNDSRRPSGRAGQCSYLRLAGLAAEGQSFRFNTSGALMIN
jgi:hypothetical protein